MTRENGAPIISCENDLGGLMAAGTQEAKAIVLGGMSKDVLYTQLDLHRDLFLEPQGEQPQHIGSPSTQMEYCEYSLIPAGCVEVAHGSKYRLTEFGNREGKAYAGHVLALSLEADDLSLRSLFGMARTLKGKQSLPPLDRIRIFRELLTDEQLHPSDISDNIDMGHKTVVANLRWLHERGIVDYEGIDTKDYADHITYDLPEDFDLDAGSFEVREMIYDTIRHLVAEGQRQPTLNGFMEALHGRYPDAGFDERSRRATAIGYMNKLVKAGDIGKNVATGKYRSSLKLVDSTRPVIERSVAIADGMLSGDEEFLRDGRRQLRAILGDQEAVRTLIAKAFRDSPEANGMPFAERAGYVREYLEQHGGASLPELAAALEATGMTYFSVRGTMIDMRKSGTAVSVPVEGQREHRWSLAPETAAA